MHPIYVFKISVQLLSYVQLFAIPWTVAHQASLSITSSWNLLKLMSIRLVMPSNHLFCQPLLLLPSVFPSIRVFANESVLHIRCPKYWSFSFSICPFSEYSELISFRIGYFLQNLRCSPDTSLPAPGLQLNFTASWGDLHYLGLTGLEVVGQDGQALPINPHQISASPRDLNDLPEYTDDSRTLDK